MRANETTTLTSFGISVALHAILLLLLIMVVQFQSSPPPALKAGPQIIQATALMQAPPRPLPPAPPMSKPESKPEPKPAKPEKPAQSQPKPIKPEPTKNTVNIATQKQKELAAKKLAEAKKAKAAKVKAEKALLQKQRELKQQQKLAQQKALQAQQDKLMQQQLAAEQQQISAARAQEMQGVVDKYKALILQAIGQNWIVPPNVNKQLSSELLIRLAPDGTVIEVKLSRSSGNDALDQSAITAVYKASPLPVPTDAAAFQVFRQFVLTVRPETVGG